VIGDSFPSLHTRIQGVVYSIASRIGFCLHSIGGNSFLPAVQGPPHRSRRPTVMRITPLPGGELHPQRETRAATWGCAVAGCASSCSVNRAMLGQGSQRSRVHGFQGRVFAAESSILLPAHGRRSCQSVCWPASFLFHQRKLRFHCVRNRHRSVELRISSERIECLVRVWRLPKIRHNQADCSYSLVRGVWPIRQHPRP
jgi:hypothetical protein